MTTKSSSELRFECVKCGECCRQTDMIVTVTASDILKLMFGLGFNSGEVLRALDFYVLRNDDLSPDGLREIPQVKTERGLAYVALKKMEDGSCVFLKDNLCMIHSIRPMVCSSFPFVFSEREEEVTWSLHSKKNICPGLGQGEMITSEMLLDMSKEPIDEIATFRKIVSIWNNRVVTHTAEGFIEYLIKQVSKDT